MLKRSSQPETAETMMAGMVDAIRTNREGALQTWSRTCDLYARYFSALAKAQGPEAVFAANADFLASGLDVLGGGPGTKQRDELSA